MTSADPDDPDRRWLASLTALCVEDDATTSELLCRFLARRTRHVIAAPDGVEGLARFRDERPDLVVTDIQMPGMDGLAMSEAIRQLAPGVPIVVVTAFEQNDYLLRAIDVGVDKYVTKPVDTDKLELALLACARALRAEALLEREHQRELDELRLQRQRAVTLLAGGIAHDCNNLIQVILGNAELAIALAPPNTELRDVLADLTIAAHEAAELGERLLLLSTGRLLNMRSQPVNATIRLALTEALRGSDTHLVLNLPRADNLVTHDAELLAVATLHLATNARTAMHDGGTLRVRGDVCPIAPDEVPLLEPGDYFRLRFQDTGPGIPPEHLDQVCDPYFTTKPRGAGRGLGLGLALCQAVAQKHQGAMQVTSELGHGATLTLLLPLAGPTNVGTSP